MGVGGVLKGTEAVVFDVLSTGIEIISDKASEAKKKMGFEKQKTNSPTTSTSKSSQSKPQSSVNSSSNNSKSTSTVGSVNINKQISDTINNAKAKVKSIIKVKNR